MFVTFLDTPFLNFIGIVFHEASFSKAFSFTFDFFFVTYESLEVPFIALKVTFLGVEPLEVESIEFEQQQET